VYLNFVRHFCFRSTINKFVVCFLVTKYYYKSYFFFHFKLFVFGILLKLDLLRIVREWHTCILFNMLLYQQWGPSSGRLSQVYWIFEGHMHCQVSLSYTSKNTSVKNTSVIRIKKQCFNYFIWNIYHWANFFCLCCRLFTKDKLLLSAICRLLKSCRHMEFITMPSRSVK